MDLLRRVDVIDDGRGYAVDDGRIDTLSHFDRETGLVIQKPVRISLEQAKQVEIDGLRHALESVEHRILVFDPDDLFSWEEPLTEAKIERLRSGLEAERQYVLDRLAELAELERLQSSPAESSKKGRRR